MSRDFNHHNIKESSNQDIDYVLKEMLSIYLRHGRKKALEYHQDCAEISICRSHFLMNCPECLIEAEKILNSYFDRIDKELTKKGTYL